MIHLLFFLCFASSLFASQAVYITIKEDPSTEMVVHWIEDEKENEAMYVLYRLAEETKWQKAESVEVASLKDYRVKHLVLQGLQSDRNYCFRIGEERELFYFHTLPSTLSRPLRIAIGGDVYQNSLERYEKMTKVMAENEPDFAILGGDLAYANQGKQVPRWVTFFQQWQRNAQVEGRLVPLVAAIGNHDRSSKQNLFPLFFPYLEKESYGSLQVGGKASFFLLDTGHMHSIEGEQTQWLEKKLQEDTCAWRFAVYHVAAYPSVYGYKDKVPTAVRKQWCPLFDTYRMLIAFEHHNHAFKKTFPLRGGQIDPQGTVYFGDGSWSISPRRTHKEWYLEMAEKKNAFSLLILSSEGIKVKAIDIEKNVLMEWEPGP